MSTNVFPDLTLENHGFWDLPYQICFAALIEPIVAYRICGRPIPEAFHAHALEEGDQILKWLVLPDGDLLCPQGIDWAERDVQHSWAFTELGTLLDQPWARAAEARCLKLLGRRQAVFGDGSIHALDFGYETDLAVVWTYSFLLHKFFGKGDSGPGFDEPRGAKLFPYVCAAVHRTPDLISSVTWFRSRQAIMVSPNHLETMASRPAFTRYDEVSGTGWIRLKGDARRRPLEVEGEPRVRPDGPNGEVLTVFFSRALKGRLRQQISYCALPLGAVAVWSRWQALGDLEVTELVDHPFRWVQIEGFIPPPGAAQPSPGVWVVDDKLRLQVIGATAGELARDGINGAVRRGFSARAGDVLQDSVCVYQALVPGRAPWALEGGPTAIRVGDWHLQRDREGGWAAAHAPPDR